MKYLLIAILGVILFSACSDEVTSGKGDNVVVGVWDSYYKDTDSLTMTRVFTHGYLSYFSFAEGRPQNQFNKQRYYITNEELILERYTQLYKLNRDTLWITNSLGDQVTKYIRNKTSNIDLDPVEKSE